MTRRRERAKRMSAAWRRRHPGAKGPAGRKRGQKPFPGRARVHFEVAIVDTLLANGLPSKNHAAAIAAMVTSNKPLVVTTVGAALNISVNLPVELKSAADRVLKRRAKMLAGDDLMLRLWVHESASHLSDLLKAVISNDRGAITNAMVVLVALDWGPLLLNAAQRWNAAAASNFPPGSPPATGRAANVIANWDREVERYQPFADDNLIRTAKRRGTS